MSSLVIGAVKLETGGLVDGVVMMDPHHGENPRARDIALQFSHGGRLDADAEYLQQREGVVGTSMRRRRRRERAEHGFSERNGVSYGTVKVSQNPAASDGNAVAVVVAALLDEHGGPSGFKHIDDVVEGCLVDMLARVLTVAVEYGSSPAPPVVKAECLEVVS